MKLFFCDICNESIPLQDIKENRSTTIKGKIFCRKCNPLNELTGGEPSGSSSTAAGPASGMLALVALLLVLTVAGLAYVIYEMKFAAEKPEAGRATAVADLESRVGDLRAALTVLQKAFEDLEDLREVPERLESMQEESAGQSATLARMSKDVAELQDGLVAVGKLRERVEGLSLRQDESGQKISRLFASVEGIRTDLTEVSDRPPVIVSSPGPATEDGGGGGGASAPTDVAPDGELLAIIEKLGASDPMARWEAVDQIRRRRDQALVPHVLPLLDDGDTFVRAQAIYTLGELKAMKAVPKLVKLLRDEEIMIREEALTSLIVITGQNLKFDVTGSRSVREAGIRKWEQWMAKNKDMFA